MIRESQIAVLGTEEDVVFSDTGKQNGPNPAAKRQVMTEVTKKNHKYKNVPEDWKAMPASRFREAIAHIETVLLEISPDGRLNSDSLNTPATGSKLGRWAEHLRRALKELTK